MDKIPEFQFKGQPLTDQNMQRMLSLYMSRDKEVPIEQDKELAELFPVKVLIKRIAGYGLPFNVTNFFFLMSMVTFTEGNPGKIMMLLWLSNRHYQKTGVKLLGIHEWADIFPMGTPTGEECRKFWDSQKKVDEPLGNMLDNPNYWFTAQQCTTASSRLQPPSNLQSSDAHP